MKSKAAFPKKSGSPELMLFPKDGGCVLYNPKEGKFQRILEDLSGSRFLANSGNWLLMLDSPSELYIIDVISEKRITLPSLVSINSSTSSIKRVGDRGFVRVDSDSILVDLNCDDVSGLLWVEESGKEFVVVWFFDAPGHSYLSYCKNGDTHYTDIPLYDPNTHWLKDLSYMVLQGYSLYMSTGRRFVRVLDLSGQFFKDITKGKPFPMLSGYESRDTSIAVTTTGEVLLVESDWAKKKSYFCVYKKDLSLKDPDYCSNTVVEVNSLGGEALLLDLGFTVPADDTLGIEPDSIYFTRHYRPCRCKHRDLDICVYNLASRTFKRFPDLDGMNLMDARWFLHGN